MRPRWHRQRLQWHSPSGPCFASTDVASRDTKDPRFRQRPLSNELVTLRPHRKGGWNAATSLRIEARPALRRGRRHRVSRRLLWRDGNGGQSQLPASLVEIRRKELPTPTGGIAHIRWFSAAGLAPTLTTNLTTGHGVGVRALAEKRALAADLVTQSQQAGISLPPPTDTRVHDQPGFAYSDPLGWRSLFWVVDQDAVMSVTGLRFDDAQLQQIAEGVRFG